MRIRFKYSDRVMEGAFHPSLKDGISISINVVLPSSQRIAMNEKKHINIKYLDRFSLKLSRQCLFRKNSEIRAYGILRKWKVQQNSSLFFGLCALLCFSGTKGDWWLANKYIFFSVFASFLVAVWSYIYTHAQLRILKFHSLLAPLTDSIFEEAAHQPQFPCLKVTRITDWMASKLY